MANTKISQLPAVTTAQLTDTFPVVQSGTTKKETLSQTLTLFNFSLNMQQANGAETFDLTSGNVTINNPCPMNITVGSTNPGRTLKFPAMNESNSLKEGSIIIVYNNNTQTITLLDDGNNNIGTLPSSNYALVQVQDTSSADGDLRTLILGTISTLNSPLDYSNGGTQATSLNGAQSNLQIIGTQNLPLFFLPTNNSGATAGQASFSNGVNIPYLQFPDSAISYSYVIAQMPKRWNQGTFQLLFSWYPGTSTSGNVVWVADAAVIPLGSSVNLTFGSSVSGTSPSVGSANAPSNFITNAITPSGVALDWSWVVIRLYRDGTNGSDTLATNVFAINPIRLIWTANAGNDA
jgi:hypothetical protein